MMPHRTRLNIPLGTRLETVWRVVDPFGHVTWQVWTACADRNAPFTGMRGTALCLAHDGSAMRITDELDRFDCMDVMPPLQD